jgi:chromosome segregation ATPase
MIMLLAALVLQACGGEDCTPLTDELTKVKSELAHRDSVMDAIGTTFKAIDSNMVEMRNVETEIMTQMSARSKDKDAIKVNVDKLRTIMAMNENYVRQLEESLGASSATSASLFMIISSMEEKIEMNNLRLAHLNHDLGTLGDDFKGMFEEYMQAEVERMVLQENLSQMEGNISTMEAQMKELKTHLNTGYVAVGTKRDLIGNGVLEKGGLLRSDDVNENMDKSAFERYDIRELAEIKVGAGKVKLITEHPTESYTMENGLLKIKEPKSFWSISKYLIVVTD